MALSGPELCVAAAIVEKRGAASRGRCLYLPEDYRVISGFMLREGGALDYAQNIIEHCVAVTGAAVTNALEAIDVDDREASRDVLLIGRQDVDDETARRGKRLV